MPVGLASGSSNPHVPLPKWIQYTRKFQKTPNRATRPSHSTPLTHLPATRNAASAVTVPATASGRTVASRGTTTR